MCQIKRGPDTRTCRPRVRSPFVYERATLDRVNLTFVYYATSLTYRLRGANVKRGGTKWRTLSESYTTERLPGRGGERSTPVPGYQHLVVSRVLCKILGPGEGISRTSYIERMDNRINNAITAGDIGEARHWSRPSPHFPKRAFNRIRRSDPPPIGRGYGEKGEERFPVAQEAGHGLRSSALPSLDPVAQRALGRMAIGRLVNAAGQLQTGVPVADLVDWAAGSAFFNKLWNEMLRSRTPSKGLTFLGQRVAPPRSELPVAPCL